MASLDDQLHAIAMLLSAVTQGAQWGKMASGWSRALTGIGMFLMGFHQRVGHV